MTRDSQLPGAPEEPPEEQQGSLGPTGPGLLAGAFLLGLVAGRLVRPVSTQLDQFAPQVTWVTVLALYLAAAVIGYVAWSTYLTLQRRGERLETHQAVNRLVLAKASAIVGAGVAGGYLGYALSWLGADSDLGGERLLRSLVAAVAGVLIVAGSLVLERACRVRNGS
ncbi:MAG TPA: DUF3180 domain-containing protein [Nocardioidaceae bacterium]|nr:DUF3180 domain-containing protein [Nocardioidaceae bacterium]